eukprot:13835101-Alexandrium_andersonii.AAC.1
MWVRQTRGLPHDRQLGLLHELHDLAGPTEPLRLLHGRAAALRPGGCLAQGPACEPAPGPGVPRS